MNAPLIAPVAAHHRADWERLYAGYATFYKVSQTAEMRDTVWNWLMDTDHEVNGLVAENQDGRAIGLAHYRPFARPLSASIGGFLDDLFVAPEARGGRVADALIEAVAAEGRRRGWSVIRWITADDNYRGRGVYDRLATRTMWITYDKKLP
ncbi:GNAT family N-acetyltransferase [Falsiroseomonas sp.]|uniref:GNAT family N-acetyltransferase n=1 Tax=Falsiroseomonas sp. TaxID=2870721 RepID=UPI00356893E0